MMILVDTNLLMAIVQFHIDVFSEIERIAGKPEILDKSIDELKKLATKKDKHGNAARLVLKIITTKKIIIVKTTSDLKTDDLLVQYSHQGSVVATQDRELQKRLKKPYIVMRSRNHLELVE